MLIARYAKIVMVACLAIFCLIIVFTNLTDYSTNFLFVKHVLSMDTTFPGNALMYRSITGPTLWNAAYVLIIAADAVVGAIPCRSYPILAGAERPSRSTAPRVSRSPCARGLPSVVLRLHGDRRGVVRHVAVDDLERSGACPSASTLRRSPC